MLQATTTNSTSAFGYARRQHCPSCGAEAAEAPESMHSMPRAESLPVEEHGKFLSGYDATRIFFSYCRCQSCGLLFCPIYYSPAQLAKLYGLQSENMAEVPLSARLKTQQRYVQLLAPETTPEGDYLELGADIAIFARLCSERKSFRRYWLYEPNSGVREEIDRRMNGLDYTVSTQDFALSDVEPNSISVAVVVHVLDHVWQPRRVLTDICSAMRPGGRIFVATHDQSSMLARVLGKRWPPYTLQHPQLFSEASLRALVQRSGFEVARTAKTVNYFPLPFLASAALQVMGMPGRFIPAWPRPQIGLRLGNVGLVGIKQ